jgi:hypothetical protein
MSVLFAISPATSGKGLDVPDWVGYAIIPLAIIIMVFNYRRKLNNQKAEHPTSTQIIKKWKLQFLVAVVLYTGVAIYAYVKAVGQHTGVEYPSGRWFAVLVFFAFSAFCGYKIIEALKYGVVGLGGGAAGGGGFYMRRDENPSGFIFFLLIYLAISLLFFYLGVSSIFAT